MTRAALAYLAAIGVATAAPGHWFARRTNRESPLDLGGSWVTSAAGSAWGRLWRVEP